MSVTATSAAAATRATHRGRHKLADNFSQQKLRAWQPVLTPKWIVSVFLGFGAVFMALGGVLLYTSNQIIECELDYRDPPAACSDITQCTQDLTVQITANHCSGPSITKIDPPIYFYYGLTNYYQNHRRYVRSRSDPQLRGEAITDVSELESCEPIISGPESGKIYSPCGLVAWSVFNDTFVLKKGPGSGSPVIQMVDDADTIAWSTDVLHKFKNPTNADDTKIDEWLNPTIFPGRVENAHFIVWMRSAALPSFRKLYAKITEQIQLPITVEIANRYPVASFGGTKHVVISSTSWLGGKNSFLGIAYLVIGAWCLMFGIFFCVKNYQHPRILGDVRFFGWVTNRRHHATR